MTTQQKKNYRAIFRRLLRCFYIAVINFKGGVGKTTSATTLGYYFASMLGLRVLLIDCDFQNNSGKALLPPDKRVGPTLTHVLRAMVPLHAAIRKVRDDIPLYLLPSDDDLPQAVKYLNSMAAVGHKFLRASLKALEQGKMLDRESGSIFGVDFTAMPGMYPPIPDDLKEQFDIVIFDCASMNAIVENAFYASDALYIPVQMKHLSVDGLYEMKKSLHRLMKQLEHSILTLGVTPYATDERYSTTEEYRDLVRTDWQSDVTSSVRTDGTIDKAQRDSKTIYEYDYRSKFATDFAVVAEELYDRIEGLLLLEEEMKAGRV